MNTSQRFAISIHALTLLALSGDPLTSDAIASSVDTNPVVIRRTMAGLRAQKIVKSKSGANGGWHLACSADQILLSNVYRALEEQDILSIHPHPNKECRVGKHIKGTLSNIFATAQSEMERALAKYTVADVMEDILMRQRN
jgi:Rrf2 family protein